MYDVWVSGAFDARESKPAMGAWLCPALGTYAVTKRARAVDLNDGLRIGCAMAILSAVLSLGNQLVVHLPSYPTPRWVADPRRSVPLPNLMYRLLYSREVHPRIESRELILSVTKTDNYYTSQLHALLTRGEVPKQCIW